MSETTANTPQAAEPNQTAQQQGTDQGQQPTQYQPTQAQQEQDGALAAIFAKLDTILDKRTDGIAKSVLKDSGYADDDLKDILTQYRESKKAQVDTAEALKEELEQEKAERAREQMERAVERQARVLGIDEKTLPYIFKMADLSQCTDDKGGISAEKVKAALEKVLADVPGLKQTDGGKVAGITVGADTSSQAKPDGNIFGFNFTGVRNKT